MAIKFPKKDDKVKTHLIDLLRILCWNQYKIDNPKNGMTGLALYEQFFSEWITNEVHQMTVAKIEKMISDLGYTLEELEQDAKDYYDAKKAYKSNVKVEVSHDDNIPY